MARYCPKCFSEISENANYCPVCGECMRETESIESSFVGSDSVKTVVTGFHDKAIQFGK